MMNLPTKLFTPDPCLSGSGKLSKPNPVYCRLNGDLSEEAIYKIETLAPERPLLKL